MVIGEALAGALRLAHALAAAAWVGGALVYLLTAPTGSVSGREDRAERAFREVLRTGVGVFIVTGAIMAIERLSSAPLPPAYFAILGAKVGLGFWMFALARQLGMRRSSISSTRVWWQRPEGKLLVLGVIVYSLAIALRSVYETTIRS